MEEFVDTGERPPVEAAKMAQVEAIVAADRKAFEHCVKNDIFP